MEGQDVPAGLAVLQGGIHAQRFILLLTHLGLLLPKRGGSRGGPGEAVLPAYPSHPAVFVGTLRAPEATNTMHKCTACPVRSAAEGTQAERPRAESPEMLLK